MNHTELQQALKRPISDRTELEQAIHRLVIVKALLNEERTDWTSFDASPAVRTKGFEIDGSNDPKRGFKGWVPTTAIRHRRGFTGATAADMPHMRATMDLRTLLRWVV